MNNVDSEVFTKDGVFLSESALLKSPYNYEYGGFYKCNPADHCMTVEKFLADGHRFVDGDIYMCKFGDVNVAGDKFSPAELNKPDYQDALRYILRAAALEEKEPELTKDDSPQGILSAISNRLHNVGCEHQNLAFGHELSGMACDIWGVLPLISNESIQGKKPRTKVEYVKSDIESRGRALDAFDGEVELFELVDGEYKQVTNESDAISKWRNLYERIETPMTEREAFIDALNDLFQSHTMSTSAPGRTCRPSRALVQVPHVWKLRGRVAQSRQRRQERCRWPWWSVLALAAHLPPDGVVPVRGGGGRC
jgi:hypothetical protein